jgi:ribosomal subunit interface protein
MNLTLTGRHIEITPYLKNHVALKTKKLERYKTSVTQAEIVLAKDSTKDIAEGKVHLGHSVLTATGKGDDMYMAVNDLVDKLLVQLRRHDGKLRARKRQPSK